MSRYLSGRLGSSASESASQSRTVTPEKTKAQAPVLDTPHQAARTPAGVADDSSPPRVSSCTQNLSSCNLLTRMST